MTSKRIALKPEEWPAPDREAWHAALVPGDLLDDNGPAAKWAPATRSGVSSSYGRWLAWLSVRGALDREQVPADRATREVMNDYVAYLCEQHATSSVVAYLALLVMALKALEPDQDWSWLQQIIARLKMKSTPVREKWRRLQDTDDLLALGMDLMAAAEKCLMGQPFPAAMSWEGATQYRDGLMIALLALRPLRKKNFCAIQIGRHLIRQKGRYALIFERGETKNGQALELPFPPELVPALERYLNFYRPWLCRQTANRDPRFPFKLAGQYLWVSKTGSALSTERMYITVNHRTAERFGRSVNAHLFRDCAATTIATGDPEHVRITMSILGHTSMQTSERYYNHAQGVDAARKMQEHILRLRHAAIQISDVPCNTDME